VDDRHAEASGRGNVHRVEPDAVAPDDLEPLAGGHEALRAARLGPEQDAVGVGGDLQEGGLGLLVAQHHAGLALQVGVAVGVDGTGEDDEGAVGTHRGLLSGRTRRL
jgi:hypothetical protein